MLLKLTFQSKLTQFVNVVNNENIPHGDFDVITKALEDNIFGWQYNGGKT